MYSVLMETYVWRQRMVLAECISHDITVGTGRERRTIPFPDSIARTWWKPIPQPAPPPPLTFALGGHIPPPDCLPTVETVSIYTPRLIALLAEAGIAHETFPVTVLNKKTREPLSQPYRLFHLLEGFDAVDMDTSETTQTPFGTTRLLRIVLNEACLHTQPLLFRLTRFENIVLIRNDLKAALKAAGITGVGFCQDQ